MARITYQQALAFAERQLLAMLASGTNKDGTLTTADGPSDFQNKSGTVQNGGQSQEAVAANPLRRHLTIQNPSTAAESFFFNFTDAATVGAPSVECAIGQTYMYERGAVPSNAINVTATTAGTAFVIKEG